ncbi:DEAD-box ATP-dependent RNA helicase 37-like protein [Tanacetum coccineum]|uniref:DEAD-box ATP-dependent RNA helicase 37-like protein n=1 Tax=Tanacetum coccineum TaxID=301880 RepID=A0ABQ5EM28_9ASTR
MDKNDHLRSLLQEQKANENLGKTKRSADALKNWLCRNGFPATVIHGAKCNSERALQQFKHGVAPILVAIDVASRGLDIPRVAHDWSCGKSGIATAFFNDKNSSVAKGISELMKEAKQETPHWLAQYAESYVASADHRYGSSKFGGRDFRSGNNNSNKSSDYYATTNSYGSSYYGATSGGDGNNTSYGTSDYGVPGYGNNASYGTSEYGAPSGGYGNTDYGATSDSYDNFASPPAAFDFLVLIAVLTLDTGMSPLSLEVGSD